jgi:hypothetical protein
LPPSTPLSYILRWLGAPLNAWPQRTQRLAATFATAICAALSIYRTISMQGYFHQPDVDYYLYIARGQSALAREPFVARQMGPLLVAGVARLLHTTVEHAFIALGVLYLLIMLATVFRLIASTAAPRWMFFAVLLVPYCALLFEALAFPDLLYAALIAILLLLLARERCTAAALMMFPMMFARESTWLTLVCLLVAGWGSLRWKHRLTAIGSALAGALLVHQLTLHHQPNEEHLPQLVYLAAKVPWNFMRNILAIAPWSNVNSDLCTLPAWQMPLHFGRVSAIGVCRFDTSAPLTMVLEILGAFGLLPMLIAFLWWRSRRSLARPLLTRFVLVYGVASVLLAPVLGIWFIHLFGYAWPFFLLGPALLLHELGSLSGNPSRTAAGIAFFAVHVVICLEYFSPLPTPKLWIEMALWCLAALLLRHWAGPATKPGNGHEIHPSSMVKSA